MSIDLFSKTVSIAGGMVLTLACVSEVWKLTT